MEQLLRDPDIRPTDEVLSAALGDSFAAWQAFSGKLADYGVAVEWRYYNDGKAWLVKGVFKKKTVFWGSAWEGYFRTSFFFTEKTREGIRELDVSGNIKSAIESAAPVGRLFPLLIDIYTDTQLPDVFRLIEYKKSLK